MLETVVCWIQKDCALRLSSSFSSSHTQIRVFVCICRETRKQAHTSICIFLFIFIPVTHQYAVSFCPAPFSDCLFALSLSSRLTPTLDQQHPVSLFIKCLFLQSAVFLLQKCPLCRFPHMPRSTHMLVIIHILSRAWFLVYIKDLSCQLMSSYCPKPNRTDWYLTSILTGCHYTLRPHDPTLTLTVTLLRGAK